MIERQIEINAPIEVVYSVIRDFKSYPEFIKGTDKVTERQTASGLECDYELNLIKKIQYTLKMDLHEPTGLEWSFVKGDLMKTNTGGWRLEDLGEGRTRANYFIDVSFGWMVPKKIVDALTETQLPEMLGAVKKRSEARV